MDSSWVYNKSRNSIYILSLVYRCIYPEHGYWEFRSLLHYSRYGVYVTSGIIWRLLPMPMLFWPFQLHITLSTHHMQVLCIQKSRHIQPTSYQDFPWTSACSSTLKIYCSVCHDAKSKGMINFPKTINQHLSRMVSRIWKWLENGSVIMKALICMLRLYWNWEQLSLYQWSGCPLEQTIRESAKTSSSDVNETL